MNNIKKQPYYFVQEIIKQYNIDMILTKVLI